MAGVEGESCGAEVEAKPEPVVQGSTNSSDSSCGLTPSRSWPSSPSPSSTLENSLQSVSVRWELFRAEVGPGAIPKDWWAGLTSEGLEGSRREGL